MESLYHENHSVLDDLGAEVTGIAYPVSICMAMTIFLVRLLQTENDSSTRSVVIAEVVMESVRLPVCWNQSAERLLLRTVNTACGAMQEDETAGSKLRGSLINAIVFVAIITVMTFVIVLLFKYGVRNGFSMERAAIPGIVHKGNMLRQCACFAVREAYLRLHGLCHFHDLLHHDWRHCTRPATNNQAANGYPITGVYTV